ncbi:uncharacterized protein [Musca autumnalis]|uniref:uncharacterized protein n=1 Tax=Musca autumnalis TaxID=221902 RepID=UPI003CF35C52
MQLKMVRDKKILTAIFYLLTLTPTWAYPSGGCYECEEEIWEEVPCDQIPSNRTTIAPPLSTASPETSTTATTPTATNSTTSTTPSTLTTTTTPSNDPYRKCYCECKIGCKEFCRKVQLNPQGKNEIIQITEVSEPLPQGRIESTYYHQRKLIPSTSHSHSYQPHSSYEHSSTYGTSPSVPVRKPLPKVYNSVAHYRTSSTVDPYTYGRDYNSGYNKNKYSPHHSYRNKQQTYFYSSSETDLSDLPPYYQNLYSKAIYDLEDEPFNTNNVPKVHSHDYNSHACQGADRFSSPVPVNNAVIHSDKYYDTHYPNAETYAFYDDYGSIAETPHHSLLYK